MEVQHDADTHDELARVARAKASESDDPDVALRLREMAIKHERRARQLRRLGEPKG